MAEIQRRVIEVDPIAARSRNRKNLYIIGGLTVLAAAICAGFLLIPRNELVRQEVVVQAPTAPISSGGRGQVLAGPHGTTFIIGNVGKMVGLDVSVMDIVNSQSPDKFPDLILVRGVEVQTVPGDQVFSIGTTPANSVLVKIEEPTQPGNLGESALVVRPGQKVAVSGRVDRIRSLTELKQTFGVSNYEAGRLGNTSLVIRAQTVQILEK